MQSGKRVSAGEDKSTESAFSADPEKEQKEIDIMAKITKEMTIGENLNVDYDLAGVLLSGGMYCVGCPSSQAESLEEAAMVHGIDPELLLARLNNYLDGKAQ